MTEDKMDLIVAIIIFSLPFIALIAIIIHKVVSNKRTLKKEKERIGYFRDLPCNGNLYIMFYAFTHSAKSPFTINFINAIIVKWYRENKVDIIPTNKEENYIVKFKNGVTYDHKAEQMLYHTIMSFAGKDEMLTREDLIGSLKFNLKTYQNYIDNISSYIGDEIYKLDIHEERDHLYGLKRFIEDFSMIPELPTNEVYLRDGYILFSILAGCADKIKDQFDGFIPFNIGVFYRYMDEMDNLSDAIDDFVDNF